MKQFIFLSKEEAQKILNGDTVKMSVDNEITLRRGEVVNICLSPEIKVGRGSNKRVI